MVSTQKYPSSKKDAIKMANQRKKAVKHLTNARRDALTPNTSNKK